MDLVFFCLRNCAPEHGALTDRFVMDLILICFRNLLWRALGSEGQICNGFAIDLLKKLTLKSSGL